MCILVRHFDGGTELDKGCGAASAMPECPIWGCARVSQLGQEFDGDAQNETQRDVILEP